MNPYYTYEITITAPDKQETTLQTGKLKIVEKAWVIIEEQSDWDYNGSESYEIITDVPVAVAFTLEDAQEYTLKNGNFKIVEVEKI